MRPRKVAIMFTLWSRKLANWDLINPAKLGWDEAVKGRRPSLSPSSPTLSPLMQRDAVLASFLFKPM